MKRFGKTRTTITSIPKLILALFLTLAPLAFLVGCSHDAEQHVPGKNLKGVVPITDYMSDLYSSFDRYSQGIESGTELPEWLRLYDTDIVDGYIYDQDFILGMWDALCETRIDVDHRAETKVEGDYISFSFCWGGELIQFTFRTPEYAEFADDAQFPVEDPDALSVLIERAYDKIEEQASKDGELPMDGSAYLWDADGDGTTEHMSTMFNDNGDEARSGMSFTLSGGSVEAGCYIDGAYDIISLTGGTDESGPYVLLTYHAGDFYQHDSVVQCRLRLVDGELIIETIGSDNNESTAS